MLPRPRTPHSPSAIGLPKSQQPRAHYSVPIPRQNPAFDSYVHANSGRPWGSDFTQQQPQQQQFGHPASMTSWQGGSVLPSGFSGGNANAPNPLQSFRHSAGGAGMPKQLPGGQFTGNMVGRWQGNQFTPSYDSFQRGGTLREGESIAGGYWDANDQFTAWTPQEYHKQMGTKTGTLMGSYQNGQFVPSSGQPGVMRPGEKMHSGYREGDQFTPFNPLNYRKYLASQQQQSGMPGQATPGQEQPMSLAAFAQQQAQANVPNAAERMYQGIPALANTGTLQGLYGALGLGQRAQGVAQERNLQGINQFLATEPWEAQMQRANMAAQQGLGQAGWLQNAEQSQNQYQLMNQGRGIDAARMFYG